MGFSARFIRVLAPISFCVLWAAGCATTTSSGGYGGPAPIPEGKGRLILQAGHLKQLNYFIIDEETDEEVHSDLPRASSYSPVGYESGTAATNLMVDLDPGTYTVIVNTDIKDNVEVYGVEVLMGQEKYVTVQVGAFQVLFSGTDELRGQVPFLIMDFSMRTVLGKGMTARDVRHFIVPSGRSYKIRMENSPTGFDEIRPVEVSFGQVRPVHIGTTTTPEEPDVSGGGQE